MSCSNLTWVIWWWYQHRSCNNGRLGTTAISIHHADVSLWHLCSSLQWCHNECDGVSNHRRFDCLLSRLFGFRSENTSKLRVTGLCVGNSPVTGGFPSQRASDAENVSIWWRHHDGVMIYANMILPKMFLSCSQGKTVLTPLSPLIRHRPHSVDIPSASFLTFLTTLQEKFDQ